MNRALQAKSATGTWMATPAWQKLLLGKTTPESGLSLCQAAWHDGCRVARLEAVRLR